VLRRFFTDLLPLTSVSGMSASAAFLWHESYDFYNSHGIFNFLQPLMNESAALPFGTDKNNAQQ
jgi:hypothetical protein